MGCEGDRNNNSNIQSLYLILADTCHQRIIVNEGFNTMTEHEFKLPKTAAELFASHVVEERQDPAGLRKAVVKVLGMTQVTLKKLPD